MRIGLFTDTYPPYINGVSTSVYMLKEALEKKGHQVYVVTVNNELTKYKLENRGKIVRIPGIPTGIYDYRLTGIYPLKALKIIKKWKLDIIHSHTEFGVGTFARIIAKQLGIPLVHTYHTMYEDYIHYITKGYFNRSSKKIVEYLTLFYCDKTTNELIVPTKKTYDLFKKKYGVEKNIHIIPTGIEIERFYKENIPATKVKTLKNKLGIEKDDFIITFVGRIAKEKNIDFLIDGQKDLVKKHKNIKLIIIGDGPELPVFKKKVERLKLTDSIIFTGKVPWEEVPLYYQLSSVFSTASTTETQGLTVIEAMAGSIAPVCIDDESFRNVIVDGLNGRIFKTKRSYKNIILDLYNDKTTLKKISHQARLNAEVHSSKHYAERVLDVYKHAIDNKKDKYPLMSKIFKRKKEG